MLLDKNAVKEAADISVVADEIGLPMEYRGNQTLILCPCHDDLHFGSCFLKKNSNRFICYSCGAEGDVFELVQRALNVDFIESVKIVADICGGFENFLMDGDMQEFYERKRFISREEQALIGICDTPVWSCAEFVDSKDDLDDEARQSIIPEYNKEDVLVGYCVMKRVVTSPLFVLFQAEPDVYHELIDQFCEQSICRLRMQMELFHREYIHDPTLKKIVDTTRSICGDQMIAKFFTEKISEIQRISVLHGNGALVGAAQGAYCTVQARPLNADMISAIQNSIWEQEQAPF